MGAELRSREAHERSTAAIEAIKQMAPSINNHSVMLNTLSQAVYELVSRLSAVEIVLSRYLEQNGTSVSTLLVEHISEQQQAANVANESTDDEPTTIPTETAE